jgi:chemotaxis protein MotB
MFNKNVLAAWLFVLTLASCVPARKFQDMQTLNEKLLKDNNECKTAKADLQVMYDDLNEKYGRLQKEKFDLISDTTKFGESYRRQRDMNNELNKLYDQVVKQNKELLTNASATNQKLSQELEDRKRDLDKKQQQLSEQQSQIDKLLADLKEREKKVNDLESILASKDSTMKALRNKVNDALTGFDKGDLTVYEKDGKIYVSMSDKLLFKSGSTAVDPKGKDALKKVAEVLNKNTDITVNVEGHTDNVPLNGSGSMKDNWDLSVLRATSIIRILEEYKVDPKRVIAGGRGEFSPVSDNGSAEGRSKNRRTEIILTPDLSKLYQLINK